MICMKICFRPTSHRPSPPPNEVCARWAQEHLVYRARRRRHERKCSGQMSGNGSVLVDRVPRNCHSLLCVGPGQDLQVRGHTARPLYGNGYNSMYSYEAYQVVKVDSCECKTDFGVTLGISCRQVMLIRELILSGIPASAFAS